MSKMKPYPELVAAQQDIVDDSDALWQLAMDCSDVAQGMSVVEVGSMLQKETRAILDGMHGSETSGKVPTDSRVTASSVNSHRFRFLAWMALELPGHLNLPYGPRSIYMDIYGDKWHARSQNRTSGVRKLAVGYGGRRLVTRQGVLSERAERDFTLLSGQAILHVTRTVQINAALRNNVDPMLHYNDEI